MIRPMIVISLIEANQNSDSPKKGTAIMLRRRIVTRMMVIQTAGLMDAFCLGGGVGEVSEAVLERYLVLCSPSSCDWRNGMSAGC
jgi:hypothetical protein